MESIEDPTSITGLSQLINPAHVDKKMNLVEMERAIMGSGTIQKIPESNPVEEFNKAMSQISAMSGFDLTNPASASSAPAAHVIDDSPASRQRSHGEGLSSGPRPPEQGPQPNISSPGPQGQPLDFESIEEPKFTMDTRAPLLTGGLPSASPIQEIPLPQPRPERPPAPSFGMNGGGFGYGSNIDQVLAHYRGAEGLNKEAEDDDKILLLEDIDELIAELESMHVDVSRIPRPTKENSYEDIKTVHTILRRKYDRRRCTSFSSDMIMTGAHFLEYIFNGERKFGPFQPDLRGWSNTVRPKLRWMRYETSTIISNIMQDYHVGPVGRVLLELGPSAFLYSYMRKEQNGRPNYSPRQVSAALEDLRDYQV